MPGLRALPVLMPSFLGRPLFPALLTPPASPLLPWLFLPVSKPWRGGTGQGHEAFWTGFQGMWPKPQSLLKSVAEGCTTTGSLPDHVEGVCVHHVPMEQAQPHPLVPSAWLLSGPWKCLPVLSYTLATCLWASLYWVGDATFCRINMTA